MAANYFIRHPFHCLRSWTHLRPIPFLATEVLRFLGAMNIGYAVMAMNGVISDQPAVRRITALTLALANGSQFWFDIVGIAGGRFNVGPFLPIVILDAVFCLANAAYLLMPNKEEEKSHVIIEEKRS